MKINKTRALTNKQVLLIPEMIKQKLGSREIYTKLGISQPVYNRILSGITYKDLQEKLQPKLKEVRESLLPPPGMKKCTKCGRILPFDDHFFQPLDKKKRPLGFESRCLVCKKEENKKRHNDLKMAALKYYSINEMPECECCGETIIEFLTIDHIDGNGGEHRRTELKGKYSSIGLWLKDNGYPKGFRVLCMNCNWSMGVHGYCPHHGMRNG